MSAPDAPTPATAGEGAAGGPPDDRGRGPLAAWRRTYGASPLHLLLHLAAIALIAWALSQSFDDRYSAAYLNLALWMVGGAILNDFVALPLYVGVDRLARAAWGRVRPGRPAADAPAVGPAAADVSAASDETGGTSPALRRVVRGHGHVRVPVAMSAVLLLVYFPNITHKAPIGHRLSTGLAEQPDYAGRWLAITAGLLLASAALYGLRVARARSGARRTA